MSDGGETETVEKFLLFLEAKGEKNIGKAQSDANN